LAIDASISIFGHRCERHLPPITYTKLLKTDLAIKKPAEGRVLFLA